MATPTTDLAKVFAAKLDSLELTRSKMEQLFDEGLIELSDVERVYSGLVLEAFTSFEGLLEDLFLGLLGRVYTSPHVQIMVTIQPESDIREVLVGLGKGNYLEWIPYDNAEKRAELFFKDGIPFTQLGTLKGEITDLAIIRNIIAHQSEYSQGKFQKNIIGAKILNPAERTPLGYLRGRRVIGGSEITRYEYYIQKLKEIANHLCK